MPLSYRCNSKIRNVAVQNSRSGRRSGTYHATLDIVCHRSLVHRAPVVKHRTNGRRTVHEPHVMLVALDGCAEIAVRLLYGRHAGDDSAPVQPAEIVAQRHQDADARVRHGQVPPLVVVGAALGRRIRHVQRAAALEAAALDRCFGRHHLVRVHPVDDVLALDGAECAVERLQDVQAADGEERNGDADGRWARHA